MNVQAIETRRSIRKYVKMPVPEEFLEKTLTHINQIYRRIPKIRT